MKTLTSLLLAIKGLCALGQQNEFKVHSNGLIYNEQTMTKLSHIVDSLNLRFKVCDINRAYTAMHQTIGHVVELKSGNIQEAKKDMTSGMPYTEFVNKYRNVEKEEFALILRSRYEGYGKAEVVEIEHFNLKNDYGFSYISNDLSLYNKQLKGQWLYTYKAKSEYSDELLQAFYFIDNFHTATIPAKYSRMIGYSDFLVDTTTAKFKKDAKTGNADLPENWQSLSQKKKRELLEKMRSTRVVGFCSMDNSPRRHAVNIALLSAETANWEIFLKAHLDIMNDRFERMSDGSYAWAQRNTYIKELEDLNIDVKSLIFGITLRMSNPAEHHYFGSISRLGRALAETKNKDEMEQAMLSAIEDNELDDFNRLMFYYLFKNYNYYQQSEIIKNNNETKLSVAASKMPYYISCKLTKD